MVGGGGASSVAAGSLLTSCSATGFSAMAQMHKPLFHAQSTDDDDVVDVHGL
jgi:major membrane immunogen (membrane-anchored lipoprotein)